MVQLNGLLSITNETESGIMKEFIVIETASAPEEIFGKTKLTAVELKIIYRRFAAKVHPDKVASLLTDRATAAFQKLTTYYENAEKLIADGLYNRKRATLVITTKAKVVYEIFEPLCEYSSNLPVEWSPAAHFYRATMDGKSVLLKISKAPNFNAMLKQELLTIKALTSDTTAPPEILNRFMNVIDSFESTIDGINRVITVVADPGKFVSLAEIMKSDEYKNSGIDKKHIAWMWRRTLETLMHFESNGFTYGSAVPDNLLFNPDTHEIKIMDLCQSCKLGDKMTSIIPKWKNCYPPEVLSKESTVPSTDTFIAASSMLLAQQVDTAVSSKIIHSYFTAATLSHKNYRTPDALTLYKRYDEIIHERLGWQKKFVVFPLKGFA